jgi:hypothetical protein
VNAVVAVQQRQCRRVVEDRDAGAFGDLVLALAQSGAGDAWCMTMRHPKSVLR